MELSKARGICAGKAYIGHLVTGKERDDFSSDEEYEKFMKNEERKEYIELREPTNDELRSVELDSDSYYKDAPDSLKETRFLEYEARKKENEKKIESVVIGCVTGSSLTDGGKPSSAEDVREYVRASVNVYAVVAKKWAAIAQGFRSANEKK